MRTIPCLFISVFLSLSLFSQKTVHVEKVWGSAIISGDVSPNAAKLQALNDAKVNALKAAGIGEHINSYKMLFTSQDKKDYSQFFSSDIQSEIQGAVKSYKILSEKTYCKNDFEIVCDISIDADVIKYDSKADITFNANIEGIRATYQTGESLGFKVRATQHCYLTIFNITDQECSLLYPNQFEKQEKLKGMETYKFPTVEIDYSLGSNLKQQETNRLIFVFTKSEVPFIKMDKDQATTQDNIFNWIYSIPPDQRRTEYYTLSILK
jgi:hypothetical protein